MAAARGYAGALRGQVLIKTVSECVRGAMVNTLALEGDLWADNRHTDVQVRAAWLDWSGKLPQYTIVPVECVAVAGPVDCAVADMETPPPEPGTVGGAGA